MESTTADYDEGTNEDGIHIQAIDSHTDSCFWFIFSLVLSQRNMVCCSDSHSLLTKKEKERMHTILIIIITLIVLLADQFEVFLMHDPCFSLEGRWWEKGRGVWDREENKQVREKEGKRYKERERERITLFNQSLFPHFIAVDAWMLLIPQTKDRKSGENRVLIRFDGRDIFLDSRHHLLLQSSKKREREKQTLLMNEF